MACVKTDDLWRHMQAFWQIAEANPGPDGHPSRNSGEPGYKASVDYVAGLMRQAGYNVTIQPYTFDYFAYQGVPTMSEVSPTAHDYTLIAEWNPGRSIGQRDGRSAAGRGHRHAADRGLDERLRPVRLQRLRAGTHRADPARHLHVRARRC